MRHQRNLVVQKLVTVNVQRLQQANKVLLCTRKSLGAPGSSTVVAVDAAVTFVAASDDEATAVTLVSPLDSMSKEIVQNLSEA
jgi:transcription elongation GreA/GreB family factor